MEMEVQKKGNRIYSSIYLFPHSLFIYLFTHSFTEQNSETGYTVDYIENFKNCSLLWLKEKIHRAALGDETGELGRNAVRDIKKNSESILERLLKV